MANLGVAAGWGLLVGGSLVVGAGVAAVRLPSRVAATITAFGGGTLLAAIALELVPEADREAGTTLTALGLVAGTLIYVGANWLLNRDSHRKAMRRSGHAAAAGGSMSMPKRDPSDVVRGESIASGIFVDGVPESIALGLTIAEGRIGVALLAGVVIGNLVESYGSAQSILAGGRSRRFAVGLLALIGVALALATIAGATLLADASPAFVGTAQAVAAGAVLAVVSIAVIPHAFKEVSSLVASATMAGFVVGYLLS